MFRNYLKSTFRQIIKNRLFSAINIIGLAIGMMSCILIMLFVRHELSYDEMWPDTEKIVRVHGQYFNPGRAPLRFVQAPAPWAAPFSAYAADEVETSLRMFTWEATVLQDGKPFDELIQFADPSFFDLFPMPFIHGSPEASFQNPLDSVISERKALKYFGRTDVVGETMTYCCFDDGEKIEITVRGVFQDLPVNTHLNIDMLIVLQDRMFDFAPGLLQRWTNNRTYLYFKAKDGVSAQELQNRLWTWLDTESPLKQRYAARKDDVKVTDFVQPNVMPVQNIHLYAQQYAGFWGNMKELGDIKIVYAFSGVALLILLIASVNFMNLSTAKAIHRSREVALRKVLGATRGQVAFQFLGEAVVMACLALLLSLVTVELVLPYYSDIIGRELGIEVLSAPSLLLSIIAITVMVGLFSGSYPAVYLSRFLPVQTLKASMPSGNNTERSFRAGLVVFQFAVSISLIICTAVVYGQTKYARTFDTGLDTENKLVLHGVHNTDRMAILKAEFEKLPGVTSVALSGLIPSENLENNRRFSLLDEDVSTLVTETLNVMPVGYDFFEAYGVEHKAGRLFDSKYATDQLIDTPVEQQELRHGGVVINEAAVNALGILSLDDAIGRTLQVDLIGRRDVTIVGVVPDLYFRSIKYGVRPFVYFTVPENTLDHVTISYSNANTQVLVDAMSEVWSEIFPESAFNYEHLSELMNAQYQDEASQAALFGTFALLAIIIACLGLYGLAAYTAERRTKEIGIRKVLGATVVDIVRLLVWQFTHPVLLANILVWPVTWYVMNGWLEGFTYRLHSGYILTVAIPAGLGALVVAWVTVAGRAYRVAQTNPISALRYE